MTILSAQSIRKLAKEGLLFPFSEKGVSGGVSHGLGPHGYDVRVEFDDRSTTRDKIIKPGEFILASTIERFTMPNYVAGIVHDKSTWARRGLAVQNTVIEAGWSGWLTLELTNHSQTPICIKRGVGIAQVVFHVLDEPTELPYKGKYDNQARGPVGPKDER